MPEIRRHAFSTLQARLAESVRFINIVAGPRQVGKSTLVRQILRDRPANSFLSVSADPASDAVAPAFSSLHDDTVDVGVSNPRDGDWLVRCWKKARIARGACDGTFVLSIDEIQKIPQWSSIVKGLWDADRSAGIDMHVVLLGSSPLLVQKGLSESLAGRYELLPLTHWSFLEMREAFGFELEQYIYFGGYPGAADLISDESRWRAFVRDSLATPSIDKDILLLNRVDKPALLKQLFALGSELSGQIVAYNHLVGQLQDAGNTTTLARHLELLGGAGLLAGLQKYSGSKLRQRTSPPKLQVLNNALMSIVGGYDFAAAQADRTYWGRLIESAVGAHLCNTASNNCQIRYWREGNSEVDFVIDCQGKLTAVEVKGSHNARRAPALWAFAKNHGNCKALLVGGGGVDLGEFLSYPAAHWLDQEP